MSDDPLQDSAASLRKRIETSMADGLWAEASRLAANAADEDATDAGLQRIASGCLSQIAEFARARAYAARAAALKPGHAEFVQHYGVVLNACGDYGDAIRELIAAARLSPRQPETYSQLAFAAAQLGDFASAAELGLFAARLEPQSEARKLAAAQDLARASRLEEAVALLRDDRRGALRTAAVSRTLSGLLGQLARYEAALHEIDAALSVEPETAEFHVHRSWLLTQMRSDDAALASVSRAMELEPQSRAARRHMVNVLMAKGEIDEAVRHGGALLAQAPDDPEYQSCMSYLLESRAMKGAAGEFADIAALKRRLPGRRPPPPLRLPDMLRAQIRSISALVLRDIRGRYADSRLGFFWTLMEPLIHVGFLAIVFEFTMHGNPPLGSNFFFFYFTGVMPYLLMSHLTMGVGHVVRGNKNLLQIAQVTPFDLMAAKAIVDVFTSLLIYLVFSAMFAAGGLDAAPASASLVAESFALTALLGFGTGMICCAVFEFGPAGESVVNIVLRVLYFTSGIFYVPGAMPIFARDILSYNPFLHVVDAMRMGYFTDYQPQWAAQGYAAIFALATLLLGLVAVTAMGGRMRSAH